MRNEKKGIQTRTFFSELVLGFIFLLPSPPLVSLFSSLDCSSSLLSSHALSSPLPSSRFFCVFTLWFCLLFSSPLFSSPLLSSHLLFFLFLPSPCPHPYLCHSFSVLVLLCCSSLFSSFSFSERVRGGEGKSREGKRREERRGEGKTLEQGESGKRKEIRSILWATWLAMLFLCDLKYSLTS